MELTLLRDRLCALNVKLGLTPKTELAVAAYVLVDRTVKLALESVGIAMEVPSAEQEQVNVENVRPGSTAQVTSSNATLALPESSAAKAQRRAHRLAKLELLPEQGPGFVKVAYPERGLHQALQFVIFAWQGNGAHRRAENVNSVESGNILVPLLQVVSTAMLQTEKWQAMKVKALVRLVSPARGPTARCMIVSIARLANSLL